MTVFLAIALVTVVIVVAAAATLVVVGAVTIDVGVGRRWTPLGPIEVFVAAPPQVVFRSLAVPYASANPPREVRRKVVVLERGEGMVLAAHRTRLGPLTVTTVETVVLEEPRVIAFRLVRGPVPDVVERIELREARGGTMLAYSGELATDLWLPGRAWGRLVARSWVRVVAASLETVRETAERSASRVAARAVA